MRVTQIIMLTGFMLGLAFAAHAQPAVNNNLESLKAQVNCSEWQKKYDGSYKPLAAAVVAGSVFSSETVSQGSTTLQGADLWQAIDEKCDPAKAH